MGARKPKGINRIANVGKGHLYMGDTDVHVTEYHNRQKGDKWNYFYQFVSGYSPSITSQLYSNLI